MTNLLSGDYIPILTNTNADWKTARNSNNEKFRYENHNIIIAMSLFVSGIEDLVLLGWMEVFKYLNQCDSPGLGDLNQCHSATADNTQVYRDQGITAYLVRWQENLAS